MKLEIRSTSSDITLGVRQWAERWALSALGQSGSRLGHAYVMLTTRTAQRAGRISGA